MTWSILYVAAIVAINAGFAHVPLINGWPPLALAVGLVFVLRDLSQREIGHGVILLMLVGAAASYLMASPAVALASCAAYLVGEAVDWAVYTWSRRPLRDRVLLSSAMGTPLDSFVFLALIDALTPIGFILMTLSKMLAAALVYGWLRTANREGL